MKGYVSRWLGLGGDADKEEAIVRLPVDRIVPNRHQPRQVFDPEAIAELARTIAEHGLVQPIVVRPLDDGRYELIAGERRLRAVQALGQGDIPAIVRSLTDLEAATLALIENLHRENLTPIEEAEAYARLMELHALTQEALAQRLGKGQSTVANKLRLLTLPESVKRALRERKITERHARALLPLKDAAAIEGVLARILDEGWTVQRTEAEVARFLGGQKQHKQKKKPHLRGVSRDVRIALNTIRRSIAMVREAGIPLDVDEAEDEGAYRVTIRIPKG
ncbi:MAG: nucleoid occlusion protein [Hydrogenibacillus schlegelii]|nr:nucleoid occlusion protein [Hydrogenibacillus schlegelii]